MLLDHLVTHLRADVGRYRANVTGTLWLRVLLDSAAQPQVHANPRARETTSHVNHGRERRDRLPPLVGM